MRVSSWLARWAGSLWASLAMATCAAPRDPRASAPDTVAAVAPSAPSVIAGPRDAAQDGERTASSDHSARPSPEAATRVATRSFDGFGFERVLEVPVRSLALGEASRAAALSDVPYVYDGKSWQRRPLPKGREAEAQSSSVEIFFGRDNQPRLMGTSLVEGQPAVSVYWRHRPEGWKREPSELGSLSGSKTGLYGLLGFADPEVVCAPGSICLVKRVSGWARIDADAMATEMFLTRAGVYKASAGQLLLLGGTGSSHGSSSGTGWSVSDEALAFEPTSLCHETEARLWATAKHDERLWLRDTASGPGFVPVEVPLVAPRRLHCTNEHVWVVGGGAIVWVEDEWRSVDGQFGELHRIAGRANDEIWLAGDLGLFVGHAIRTATQAHPSAPSAAAP